MEIENILHTILILFTLGILTTVLAFGSILIPLPNTIIAVLVLMIIAVIISYVRKRARM